MSEQEATSQSAPNANQIGEGQFGACLEPPTEPATYKHQLLDTSVDEIRLIKLRKEKEGHVHCQLKVFPLQWTPRYIALSYRWGPSSPLYDIYTDGKTLKIRDILNSCLLELREDVETWLWVDQICIDQSNPLERNHQVAMMSRIYSNSTSVIVWLGNIPLAAPGEVDRFNDQDLDHASAKKVLRDIYFTRLWIVQEILLAKSVKICINGHRSVTWSRLRDRAYSRATPGWAHTINPASMYLIRHTHHSKNKPSMSLLECVIKFYGNACGDPRDKVYGLLGVVRVEDRITVDYKKSVLDVYLDVVNHIVNQTLSPDPSVTLVSWLCEIGSGMGIEESLIRGIAVLLEDHYGRSAQQTVTAVGFEKADHVQEQGYWWYECNGERFCYPCPPTDEYTDLVW